MSTKKYIFFHIGLPKTGTSSLQHFLVSKTLESRERTLVYLPVLNESDPRHSHITRAIVSGNFVELQECLVGNDSDLLISDEGFANSFYMIPREYLKNFKELVKKLGYELEVIITRREQDSWLRRYYNQAVINQSSPMFDFYSTSDSYEEFKQHSYVKKLANVDKLTLDIEEALDCTVVSFDYNKDICLDILAHLGIQAKSAPSSVINTSPSSSVIELIRGVNYCIDKKSDKYFWMKALLVLKPELKNNRVISALAERAVDLPSRQEQKEFLLRLKSALNDERASEVCDELATCLMS